VAHGRANGHNRHITTNSVRTRTTVSGTTTRGRDGASVTATVNDYVPAEIAAADALIFATVKTATTLTAGAKLLFLIAYLDE
jgi:hypothetical protein